MENFYAHSRKTRLNLYCQILKMFSLRYNFSLRFLMWKTRWKPLSLTPLLRLRWRITVCKLQRLTAREVYFFQIIFSWINYLFHVLILNCNHFNNSTFRITNYFISRHLFIQAEKPSRTKQPQPASAWRGGGGGFKFVELWVPSGARRKCSHRRR